MFPLFKAVFTKFPHKPLLSLHLRSNFSNLKEFGTMVTFFNKLSEISSRKSLTSELKDFLSEYLRQSDKEVL